MCRAHSPNSPYVHSRHTEASHHLSKLTSVLVLVILLIDWQNTWQKQFQERERDLDSQFEGTVHHTVGGTKMEMFSIRKQTEIRAGFPFVFFFFLQIRIQVHEYWHPHSEEVFTPQLSLVGISFSETSSSVPLRWFLTPLKWETRLTITTTHSNIITSRSGYKSMQSTVSSRTLVVTI